jgi:Na+-transporting methylmalonyl-CoA/oxaloacetate decarboxylase gamma subunit
MIDSSFIEEESLLWLYLTVAGVIIVCLVLVLIGVGYLLGRKDREVDRVLASSATSNVASPETVQVSAPVSEPYGSIGDLTRQCIFFLSLLFVIFLVEVLLRSQQR